MCVIPSINSIGIGFSSYYFFLKHRFVFLTLLLNSLIIFVLGRFLPCHCSGHSSCDGLPYCNTLATGGKCFVKQRRHKVIQRCLHPDVKKDQKILRKACATNGLKTEKCCSEPVCNTPAFLRGKLTISLYICSVHRCP